MIILQILVWWLILEVIGLAALPLTLRLFAPLPDRGYAFARPLGLLLLSYVLWIGASLGLLRNNTGGIIFSLLAVAALSAWFYFRRRPTQQTNQLPNKPVIITTEILFFLAFVGWAFFKAYNPYIETSGGEKWMEFAFLNSILRSASFPPHDPWLSGYGISYYYFGYVMMALLTRLSGLPPNVAFNLAVPTLFALTLTGAFSIVYNLVQSAGAKQRSIAYALLGPLFVGILGNLEGLLEVLHARGLGSPGFWKWLDIKDLNVPPQPGGWVPTRFIWWWRASRVLHDRDLLGNSMEVIDEFPFFSFMLADMHPHVLTLPFVLLALALALRLLLKPPEALRRSQLCWRWPSPSETAPTAQVETQGGEETPGAGFLVRLFGDDLAVFFLYALCLGGLAFLNTWDFPIYLGATLMAYALIRYRLYRAFSWGWAWDVARVGLGLGGLGFLLYLPFYVGFRSQAGGILPNLFNPTRLPQLLIFFGPFLFVVVSLLFVLTRRLRQAGAGGELLSRVLPVMLWVVLLPPLVMAANAINFAITPQGRAFVEGLLADEAIREQLGGGGINSLLGKVLSVRLGDPWAFLLLAVLLGWTLAVLWQFLARGNPWADRRGASLTFVTILLAVGLALPLVVEFIYLKDIFVTRMNTVFKFYFQAWVCLGLAAAFGVYWVLESGSHPLPVPPPETGKESPPSPTGRRGLISLSALPVSLWSLALALLVGSALVYPLLATGDKAGGFRGQPSLDGTAWVADDNPGDYAAIQWLNANVPDSPTILEAPGDSHRAYTYTGRVSALTGLPTLLGWGGHQNQWRGNYIIPAQREPDIEKLYRSRDEPAILTLIEEYDIKYVYVGPLERDRYGPDVAAKFDRLFPVAYQQEGVTIYRVP
jgi:YYY domain-containing protein